MLIIDSASALADALARPINPALARLLVLRRDQLVREIEDSARFIVIEPPDLVADVEAVIDFPLTWEDADDLLPTWEWAEHHDGGWTDAAFVFGDGPADVLLVPDCDGIDPVLAQLCRQHAWRPND